MSIEDKHFLLSIILTLKEYEIKLDNGSSSSDVSADISQYIYFLGNRLLGHDKKMYDMLGDKAYSKENAIDGVTPFDMLRRVYKFIEDPLNWNKSSMSGYILTVKNFITSYKEMMNRH